MPRPPDVNRNVPQIGTPSNSLNTLTSVVLSLKEGVESLAGYRGGLLDRAVTFQDLVSFGIVSQVTVQSEGAQVSYATTDGLSSVEDTLVAADAAEEAARTAADAALQDNIDDEEAARTAADDAEEAARTAADTTLQDNIDTEETARIAGDTALQDQITHQAEAIQWAITDETTTLTAGVGVFTFRMPFAMTLVNVRASLSTVSSAGNIQVDINAGGVSIFSTPLTIDVSEKTSVTAVVPAVVDTAALNDDAEITIDIDAAGTGATGLKITLNGTRT